MPPPARLVLKKPRHSMRIHCKKQRQGITGCVTLRSCYKNAAFLAHFYYDNKTKTRKNLPRHASLMLPKKRHSLYIVKTKTRCVAPAHVAKMQHYFQKRSKDEDKWLRGAPLILQNSFLAQCTPIIKNKYKNGAKTRETLRNVTTKISRLINAR